MKAVERALRRAGVPFVFSQGHHPHPRITAGTALGVGVMSSGEWYGVAVSDRVTPDKVAVLAKAIAAALPDGISLKAAELAGDGQPAVERTSRPLILEIAFEAVQARTVGEIEDKLRNFCDAGEIIYTRRRPKGDRTLDLKKFISGFSWSVGDRNPAGSCGGWYSWPVTICAVMADSGISGALRPWELVETLKNEFFVRWTGDVRITRHYRN
ncbi:MAG: TIGR03936 family radical SAM-associated protein [Negativicutes bacterium]|nr:TIGR03936 family radical SAM-associated protein [Negativicutes bacterium]